MKYKGFVWRTRRNDCAGDPRLTADEERMRLRNRSTALILWLPLPRDLSRLGKPTLISLREC